MSRSLGNAPTVPELVAQGFPGRVIRYWLLSTHYRKPLAFGEKRLRAAAGTLDRLDEFVARIRNAVPGSGVAEVDQLVYNLRQSFREAMDDDLNIAGALAALFEFVRRVNPLLDQVVMNRDNLDQIMDLLSQINDVLGVMRFTDEPLAEEDRRLLEARERARADRNFEEADRLRDELAARGIRVTDTPAGVRWTRA